MVTLTLNGATYERSIFDLRDAVAVSGVDGVTYHWFDLDRISSTKITVELKFNGNIDTDATLTFTVGADALAGYNGPALMTQLPVTAGQESVVATTDAPLTESTLDGSVVTLTLTGGIYERYWIDDDVEVSGIDGVTFDGFFDLDRISDTVITVELEFNGNIDTDATLTFTVGAGAIAGYGGPALVAQLPVTAGQESVVATTKAPLAESTLDGSVVTLTLNGATYKRFFFDINDEVEVSGIAGVSFDNFFDVDRISDTAITVELEFNGNIDTDATLTFTVGAGAIAGYNGPALVAQLPVTAGQESVVATTEAPLTEATLDGSVVTLTLTGGIYERFWIDDDVEVSGIDGVTFDGFFDLDRESDTVITVELTFNGNIDTDATLTFTVGAGAIAGYNGPALVAEVPVTGGQESVVATTAAPLTAATLDGSVVTLTLNGATYKRFFFDINDEVEVSGIAGVSFDNFFDVDRISDTAITVELEFDGTLDADDHPHLYGGGGCHSGLRRSCTHPHRYSLLREKHRCHRWPHQQQHP